MKKRNGLVAALMMLFLVTTGSLARAQDPEGMKTLRDIPGVFISVEGITHEAEKAGLTREAVETDVKEVLQKAEINLLTREAMVVTPGKPTLEVHVTTAGPNAGLYAYTLTVGLMQEVQLERTPTVKTRLPTWSVEATGYVGSEKLRTLTEPVTQLVRMFVNDYLTENPINETKATLSTNVFSGPGGVFHILGTLTKGDRLSILEERNGWYRITSNTISQGWIPKTFTEKAEAKDVSAPVEASKPVKKGDVQDKPIHEATLTQPARVYSAPGTPFDMLGSLPEGSKIDLFEERNGWYRIANDRVPYGWVPGSCVNMNLDL